MKKVFKTFKRRFIKTIKITWPTFLIVSLYLIIFTQVRVASSSMEPTLMTGDRAMITNEWLFYKPERGDIVGFAMGNELWIKRVIGLPGDTVEILDGLVYINGELLDEPYLPEYTLTFTTFQDKFVVPEKCVFLMGDNRNNSFDSRFWDDPYVPVNHIIGEYRFTVWHSKKKQATSESISIFEENY